MADTSNTAGQQSGGRRQAGQQPAGQGRLAQLIATRGGTASPEAPFVIEHREALIYMLCEAAELEHGIMCQYLYAAFSMKQGADEGLTDEELAAVRRWRSGIAHVATQEMLHLALVHNLLSAIGAAPHLVRPNLPQPANYYPAGVQLALLPFGEEALQHFMFLERPEGMDLQDADGLRAVGRAQPHLNERDIVPRGQDFATVGHLYRSIEAGLRHLVEMHGEDWLFVGPPRAQATTEHFGWPELVAVTDLASAQRAIDEILEQGEGPRGHWRDAHFGQFVEILDEYQQMLAAHPDFDPVRPVVAANVRPHERDFEVRLITDPLTARVADLFNVGYEILLQTLERFFAHTEESDAQLKTLADVTIGLMIRVLRPLGNLITTLPAGPDYPGRTAGPTFELFYEDDYLMPHQEAAWALLAERMDEAAALCLQLQAGHEQAGHEQAAQARQARQAQDVAAALAPVLGALRDMSRTLAAELPAGTVHARLASVPDPLDAGQLDELRGRARELAGRALLPRGDTAHPGDTPGPDGPGPPAPPGGGQGELADLFGAVHAIVLAADRYSPVQQALIVPRLVDSVLRPLADELDGGAAARRPGEADSFWAVARAATELRARLAGDCPPGLAEAVAALQDLAGRLAATPEQAKEQLDELWRLQAAVAPELRVAHNGPYLVTGVPRLLDYLGTETRPAPQLALCRCGQSALKPLCDGSHARTGFTDAKDPKRVADHRDTYPGQQVTIFDNRGICQHSGLCTDRLATVFRTDAEPFVAPSGGRLDEVIRAVRDCPSGALSYAIDDVEGRAQVDWGSMRPTTIEVTKDGPYRITGELALTNATGQPEPQGAGASREHYALCRCGQSRNKPFCSGMHWYVGFRDPQPPGSPTLYEWAGGGPALTRMSRLLYEKHVPADSLLAARFAQMPRDQAQRLAGWLSGALGGPGPAPAGADGGLLAVLGADTGDLGEDERARWVALAGTAADEARLPADAGFRAALSSCLEWLSRTALAGEAAADGAAAAAPRWDWGPAGPPVAQADTPGTGPADDALPGPGEEVGFAAHIKPQFRARDRQSMSFALDLWSYDDVRAHAADIVRRLQDGSMPCDGAWSAARIEVFQRWADTGLRP